MNFVLDTHTHTIASGHAYSTINEMVESAKEKALELLCITEHAPTMPGTCHVFYFDNLRVVRRDMEGIELLLGSETNILDYNGTIDLTEDTLRGLDIVIASLHSPCITAGTKEENTNALIGAMKNPYVNIIGHPDDSRFPVDYERLVLAAKENHVLLELNNSSLNPKGFRANAKENDLIMLTLCKKYDVPITLGSDAHIADDVANFCYAKELLAQTEFPSELVMNTSTLKFKQFIQVKRNLIK
ncbi:phosphatase [Anaeromicropila herbilytica]|uniref:Phosphatase n=1 Tax=Anaeromicropila herbilytica TaxID=2785025 RepID=A0A7R7EKM3_9FIRM|nr:phosphatase [Anaeromicropila herbilytica]BCN30316.1 phosphatase [Anaeromicropila herbilytica]